MADQPRAGQGGNGALITAPSKWLDEHDWMKEKIIIDRPQGNLKKWSIIKIVIIILLIVIMEPITQALGI